MKISLLTPRQSFALQNFATPLGKGVTPPSQMNNLIGGVINVESIISTLESAGHEAFIVGGCVRDMVRGTAPKDWDIATSALPKQVKALFPRTFDTGIKHGTISVLLEKECFEITTYRVDGMYLDNRRPESVTFTSKIEEDLSRRDFTINAIAYNPARGFVDPYDGRGDIKRRVIKCVGDAESRFGEDALRMLRAIRFAAVLGFSVEESAMAAIGNLKETLVSISAERIREELVKLLCGAFPNAVLLLENGGLLYYVLREREYGGDLTAVVSWLEHCNKMNVEIPLRLALFFSWADDCEKILRDLCFDNKTIKIVSLYVKYLPMEITHSRYEIKKFLRIMGISVFENLLDLKRITQPSAQHEKILLTAHEIIEKGECFTLRHLAVNGDDLANAGIPSGEAMGEKLEQLLDIVMREPSMNVKEKLLCL
ncbi:MAG: CCA tRNA nucleotidyltransferase [Defluviitaleaceae bacterium]|nr:CCA tRNA nucleotidyltransferase [Defluviitaleaceae bacterium]